MNTFVHFLQAAPQTTWKAIACSSKAKVTALCSTSCCASATLASNSLVSRASLCFGFAVWRRVVQTSRKRAGLVWLYHSFPPACYIASYLVHTLHLLVSGSLVRAGDTSIILEYFLHRRYTTLPLENNTAAYHMSNTPEFHHQSTEASACAVDH